MRGTDHQQKRNFKSLSAMINRKKKIIRNIVKYEHEPLILDDIVSGTSEYGMTSLRKLSEIAIPKMSIWNTAKSNIRLRDMAKKDIRKLSSLTNGIT